MLHEGRANLALEEVKLCRRKLGTGLRLLPGRRRYRVQQARQQDDGDARQPVEASMMTRQHHVSLPHRTVSCLYIVREIEETVRAGQRRSYNPCKDDFRKKIASAPAN